MKLLKFYTLLQRYACINLVKDGATLYRGIVRDVPDEFDELEVVDFTCAPTGIQGFYEFTFYLK